MKTTQRIGVIALLATVFLAGCYLSLDEGAGSVGIELPEPRSIQGIDSAPYARVYVLNGPTLLTIGDGTRFAEFDLAPDDDAEITEVTVGPVPAGDGYQVVLVFGDYETGTDSTEVFVPVEYALSDEFAVYGGQANVAEVSAEVTPFVPLGGTGLLGESLVGIVWDSVDLFVASDTTLYRAGGYGPEDVDAVATDGGVAFGATYEPAGKTITSLALGASTALSRATVWLNTNNGVVPFETGTFDDAFDSSSTGVETAQILDAGAYLLAGDVYGYVQIEGGLSGVWDDGSTVRWLDTIDLTEIIAGQPIYDLMVYKGATSIDAFFATKLGAFRMPQSVLQGAQGEYDTAQEVFDASDFFEVSIDGTKATITQLAVGDSDDTSLYIGTPRGAVRVPDIGQVGSTLELDGTIVALTRNLVVEDIAIIDEYVVILTNHFLVYSTDGGSTFDRVPIYASSVGEVTGMLVDSAGGVVLLSGEFGLVGIDIAP